MPKKWQPIILSTVIEKNSFSTDDTEELIFSLNLIAKFSGSIHNT